MRGRHEWFMDTHQFTLRTSTHWTPTDFLADGYWTPSYSSLNGWVSNTTIGHLTRWVSNVCDVLVI